MSISKLAKFLNIEDWNEQVEKAWIVLESTDIDKDTELTLIAINVLNSRHLPFSQKDLNELVDLLIEDAREMKKAHDEYLEDEENKNFILENT